MLEAGYAQNAIAAIAYAARAWLTDDPQEALWAARQVYEAADYGAQQVVGSNHIIFSEEFEERLRNAPAVVVAVKTIAEDLEAAGESGLAVRRRSQLGGPEWVRLLP